MLFNSIQFLIFLPLVVFIYYLIPSKYRWILLLAASYFFYMSWRAEYAFLIMFSTLIDYVAGLQMEKQPDKKKRKKYLLLSLFTNLGLLFIFKYFNFFSDSARAVLEHFNYFYDAPALKVLLPVGISFYTFQTLSYSIEVYNGTQKAEKHLGYFAVYVSFFPQLVAGPIERYARLGPQFRINHAFTYKNLSNGLRLILYGLFIKMVIADNLAIYVDQIYENPSTFNSSSISLAMIFYSFQIYSDFYGYSLIAIGSARLMGIHIMDNFKTPYLAKSITEFWQRWHISLSTWFRDYLYIPLGGNRVKLARWTINILIVFTVSGLWHGANWTFVIWGALHGILYLLERIFDNIFKLKKSSNFDVIGILKTVKTFVFVTIIWIFFRGSSLVLIRNFFESWFGNFNVQDTFHITIEHWILFGIFVLSDILFFNNRFDKWCENKHFMLRWMIYAVLLFSIFIYSAIEYIPFIYFQF